ncbi:Phage protein D [Edwardsiella tarda]|nr:Phage protein D [Edwardsiella tarda]
MPNTTKPSALDINSNRDTLCDPIKSPRLSYHHGGQPIELLNRRCMNLSMTDNRGFEADQLTLTLDDA